MLRKLCVLCLINIANFFPSGLDSEFVAWHDQNNNERLSVGGLYNSQFRFTPTRTDCGKDTSDGGWYRCTLCVPDEEKIQVCSSRTTTLLLLGSAPVVVMPQGEEGCGQPWVRLEVRPYLDDSLQKEEKN